MTMSGTPPRHAALVTLFSNDNFGNRLQNYAVQRFFESLGFQVTTLPYEEDGLPPLPLHPLISRIKKVCHFLLRPTPYEKTRIKRLKNLETRIQYISGFTKQYIHAAPQLRYSDLPADLKNQYDFFITGSDQVWHCWRNDPKELEYFFLAFAAPEQRLAFAPSFGFDTFPQKHLAAYRKGLEGFRYLSVREDRGAELIRNLTGKEAALLLDPTMLIDTSEWHKILKKPAQYTGKRYILCYIFGGMDRNTEQTVNALAGQINAQIINLLDVTGDYYTHTRPDEFLYWICHADLVITNSFHACVFSILFERPFAALERTDISCMGSRLDTLLGKFGLENRKYEILMEGFTGSNAKARQALFATDYSGVAAVLTKERRKADEYIKRCIGQMEGILLHQSKVSN